MLIRIAPVLIIALLLAAAAPAQGQDKPNPIEAAVKASLKEPTKPFVMFIHAKVKDGTGEKFEKAFAACRTATRKEKGNKAYSLTRSTKTPTEYIVYERWDNFAALQEHMKTKHLAVLLGEIGDFLDGAPEVRVFLPTRE